ncbi:MAG: TetR/AcrR family transcriptional regulator [Termitinemataceae bacterium]
MGKVRIVKEPEERRKEILDVAERLFLTKGYDNTSTTDILKELQIARGTLYYHFKSKEDILDAVTDRRTDELITKAASIVKNTAIPVLERLSRVIKSLNMEGDLGVEVMEQIHKPHNVLLHKKFQEKVDARLTPILTLLIEEAIGQGICHTDYPAEVVEMAMIYSSEVFDTLSKYVMPDPKRKIKAFIYNLERLLGMPQGTLETVLLPIFKQPSWMRGTRGK